MIIDIVKYLADKIIEYNDLELREALYLSYTDEDKGIIYQSSRDFRHGGIDDRKGNYIYFRFLEEAKLEFGEVSEKFQSCGGQKRVSTPLRLVCMLDNFLKEDVLIQYKVEEHLRDLLMGIEFDEYQSAYDKEIDVDVISSLINPKQILEEEGVVKSYGRNYLFIVIDFNLEYTYVAKPIVRCKV